CFLANLDTKTQKKFSNELARYVAEQIAVKELTTSSSENAVVAPAVSTPVTPVKAAIATYQAAPIREHVPTSTSVTPVASTTTESQAQKAKVTLDTEESFKRFDILQTAADVSRETSSQLKGIVSSNNFRLAAIFTSVMFASFLILWFVTNFL